MDTPEMKKDFLVFGLLAARFEPRTAGWLVQTLPLCYALPS